MDLLTQSQRKPTWVVRIIPFFSIITVSMGLAVLYLALNRWFGSGDLNVFFFWTLFFAIFASLTGPLVFKFIQGGSKLAKILISMATGVLLGLVWTLGVRMALGVWFWAFSFPVFYFWVIGAAVGLSLRSLIVPESD